MSILDSVSKKDSKWREIAFKISGNKQDADDLVQNMYIRLHKYNVTTWNYSFIILLLWNEYKDYKKKNNYTDEALEHKNYVTIEEFESFNDEDLKYLNRVDCLTEEQKKLITLNYDLSGSKIAENYDACRIKIYRDLIQIRKKVLRSDYQNKYKNRRLKYRNNGR